MYLQLSSATVHCKEVVAHCTSVQCQCQSCAMIGCMELGACYFNKAGHCHFHIAYVCAKKRVLSTD